MSANITPQMLRTHSGKLAQQMHLVRAREDPFWVWLGWAEDVIGDLAEFLHLNPDIIVTEPVIVNWMQNRGHYGSERMADPRQRAVIVPALLAFAALK